MPMREPDVDWTAIPGLLEQAGSYIRYGMSPEEKWNVSASGTLPGAPADPADVAARQRHGAGYLFAQQWPAVSQIAQPVVDAFKLSSIGQALGFGTTPETQSWASAGARQAWNEPRAPTTYQQAGAFNLPWGRR